MMMNEPYILGLDFGTQSAKAVLMDRTGYICAETQKEYAIHSERSGYAEQNPEQWEKALAEMGRDLQDKEPDKFSQIGAVGLSGQMHGLVLLDESRKPLGTTVLWNDVRGDNASVEERLQSRGIPLFNPVSAAYSAVKLDWLSKQRPEDFRRTRTLLFIKDYINFLLTGELNTDPTDASGSLMYDFRSGSWCNGIEDCIPIPNGALPPILSSIGLRGTVTQQASERFAIREKTPVYAAGGDLACGAVGAGLFQRDAALIILGTSAQVLDISEDIDNGLIGKKYFFQNYDGQAILGLCSIPSGGQSLSWFSKTYGHCSVAEVDRLASETDGTDGLLFIPYLQGTGSPYMDETARGAFVGLSSSHTIGHMSRAVMEGVCMGVKDCLRLNGTVPPSVLFGGGGAQSGFWAQMMADVLDTRLQSLSHFNASPIGAALMAGVGLGVFSSIREAMSQASGTIFDPIPQNAAIYATIYSRYQRAYPALKTI